MRPFLTIFCQSPVAAKINFFTKKIILPNLFLHYLKSQKFQISSSHTTKMRVKTLGGGGVLYDPPTPARIGLNFL